MAKLSGLKGISAKEVECKFIEKAKDIERILKSGKAATTAGDNGAINVYLDDEANIRCESMRYRASLEKKVYRSYPAAIAWTKKWMRIIR